LVAAGLAAASASAQNLYRGVDEKGNVVYSDRPQKADQKPTKPPAPNVESPEARRQMIEELNNKRREEAADRNAQMRRSMGSSQQEQMEYLRRLQQEQEQHPERAPRPITIVPAYR
jgi:hypothetical protein